MCGIVAVLTFDTKNSKDKKEFFEQAMVVGTLRGPHSTGVFMVPFGKAKTTDDIFVYKKAVMGTDYIHLPRFRYAMDHTHQYKFLIGHHRYTTVGTICDENAHPFQHDHITLVHNGHLATRYNLDVPNQYQIDVDSDVLTRSIALHGYHKSIPNIDGAAALVWYDSNEDTIRLYRNKERPLSFAFVKDKEMVLVASEFKMLDWLAWRNGLELAASFSVGVNQVISFKANKEYTIEEILPAETKMKPIGQISQKSKEHKLNIKEILDELRMEVGQLVQFSFDEFNYNNNKSRHGDIIGTLVDSPYTAVLARGIPRDKYNGKYILTGVLKTIIYDDRCHVPMLVVGDIKETLIEDFLNLPPQPTSSAVDSSQVVPAKEDTPAPHGEHALVLGPLGYFITKDSYRHLVRDGCGQCSDAISVEDDTKIGWTRDQTPICYACKGIPGVSEYLN